jgi:hypothetical protein
MILAGSLPPDHSMLPASGIDEAHRRDFPRRLAVIREKKAYDNDIAT